MSDEELIARLRELDTWVETADIPDLAADRIEALTAERDDFADQISELLPSVNREAVEQRQRADAAEAKLAKAMEALGRIADDCEADYPPSHGAIKHDARATLAEISSHNKGESREVPER